MALIGWMRPLPEGFGGRPAEGYPVRSQVGEIRPFLTWFLGRFLLGFLLLILLAITPTGKKNKERRIGAGCGVVFGDLQCRDSGRRIRSQKDKTPNGKFGVCLKRF